MELREGWRFPSSPVLIICSECGQDASDKTPNQIQSGDRCPLHPKAQLYRIVRGRVEV